nr:uncharacterized protein LOC100175210 isoform X1 [Ciona intestinalis]|eukprot:XP_018668824.1 uncharacterized protein LOC100175210 isoform X1 [Ciona intestinalis]
MFRGWIFLQSLIFITTARAYFGLTGKSQLREWRSIRLQSSSIASLGDFNIDEPEPSRDFQPIDLSPTTQYNRKRVANHARRTLSDQALQSNRTKYNRPFSIPKMDIQANIPAFSRPNKNNQNPTKPRHDDVTSGPTYITSKFTSSRRPHNYRRRNSTSQRVKLNTFSQYQQSARKPEYYIRGLNLSAIVGNPSVPHVRSERESGKKRDLFGIHRKPSTYFVSSSFHQSLPSSSVNMRPMEEHISERSQTVSNTSRNIAELSHINSYNSFVNERKQRLEPLAEPNKINRIQARRMCDSFKLTTSQRRKCKRDPGLPQVLSEATHIAALECQYQFRYERWNCSLGTTRIHILNKGNKETAFLFSISSAGLTHSIARACAKGHLRRCSCDDSYIGHVTDQSWRWGGCSDNVHYAAKFVRRFLRSRSTSRDIRAEVDKHNSDLGIRVVKSNLIEKCKCHGVSGSCTTKTCWRKVVPFYEISRKIKRAYDKAVKVGSINNLNGRTRLIRLRRSRLRQRKSARASMTSSTTQYPNSSAPPDRRNVASNTFKSNVPLSGRSQSVLKEESPRNKELVYLENSPSYCRKSRYSEGTKGRICENERSCHRMCCGRGYTTHVRVVRSSCECVMKWCCVVHCNTCTERKMIHTCR